MIELGEYELLVVDLEKDKVKLGHEKDHFANVKLNLPADTENQILIELGSNIGKKFKLILQPVEIGYVNLSRTIDARDIVQSSSPTVEGNRLAVNLLARECNLTGQKIDLTCLPVELLISPFFNSFLQLIYERAPQLLEAAKQVNWLTQHSFQRENIAAWVKGFNPYIQKE